MPTRRFTARLNGPTRANERIRAVFAVRSIIKGQRERVSGGATAIKSFLLISLLGGIEVPYRARVIRS